VNSLPNWYDSDRTNVSSGTDDDCQNCPGAQWTGSNPTLTEYVYDFVLNAANGEVDLTNETNVVFRIVFHSDPAVTQEGAVIDDFVIEGTQNDDDDDNDGILDINDNCPLIANADQANNDMDAEGDACDPDDDNDGIIDTEDNCPFTANADQADTDADGIGDVCDDDSDNDGVPNGEDQCPDTPEGTTVDISGCAVFTLPPTNFRVQTKGTTCIGKATGEIIVEAVESLNYTATLTDATGDTIQDFTETTSFTGLAAGTYSLCFTISSEPGYVQCFNLQVVDPEPLSVSSKISNLDGKVTIDLRGGKRYIIELNGKVVTTTENQITLPLERVENNLKVSTEQPCQGSYQETIVLSENVIIYPNPVATGRLNVYLGKDRFQKAKVSLFTLNGVNVFSKELPLQNNEVDFNVDALPNGIYLLNVRTESKLLNYKIVKR
ncbi:MAG: T9SS type A sorting domain-containing protein, partial [Flavobacteriaceae bacterium]|nr:T9SS type A sorting domain-containing protein [Flavobacteriaceae bacterium]